MNFKDTINWLIKAAKYTLMGGGVGAATGATSGAIGTVLASTLITEQYEASEVGTATLATMTGSTLIGAVIGFSEATPWPTSKIMTALMLFSPPTGLLVPPLLMAEQALSAVIGFEILKELLESMDLGDLALNSAIGALFTMFLIMIGSVFLCGCFPCNSSDYGQRDPDAPIDPPVAAIDVTEPTVIVAESSTTYQENSISSNSDWGDFLGLRMN